MKSLLMIGSSGHASTILEALELRAEYQVVGLLDSGEPVGRVKHGYRICGKPEEAASLSRSYDCRSFFVAIGDNWQRWKMTSFLRSAVPEVDFPTVIYPNVFVSKSARIGPGTVVMASGSVMANAQIGVACIVNTASSVNHDCRLADYSSVSAGVHMGGASAVGFRSSIGIGCTLREKAVVGQDTVIGAGAVVMRDIPDEVVAYGVPAKVMRARSIDESYMI